MPEDFEPLAVFMRKIEIAEIATAIEDNGCYGYDEYGRYGPVKDTQKVLNKLGEFYQQKELWFEQKFSLAGAASSEEERATLMYEAQHFPGDFFIDSPCHFWAWHYGWPAKEIPQTLRTLPRIAREVKIPKDSRATWQEQCRDIATQINEAQLHETGANSLERIAEVVAETAREKGIRGARNEILTASYIKRNALQGAQWNSTRRKH